jgi:hypothetical protein
MLLLLLLLENERKKLSSEANSRRLKVGVRVHRLVRQLPELNNGQGDLCPCDDCCPMPWKNTWLCF